MSVEVGYRGYQRLKEPGIGQGAGVEVRSKGNPERLTKISCRRGELPTVDM